MVDGPASLAAIEAAGVDLTRVRQLGAEFRTSTGLPLLLVDSTGRDLWSLGGCPLRGKLPRSRKMAAACRDHHRTAIEESFRWGEPYISVCPFGLVTFAVPISQEKRLKAGLVSGFSVFPQMEKDIREEVLRSLAERGIGFRLGPRTKLRFRVVPSETLRRNADLLFELTGKTGVNDLELINESREKSIQQFTIANYLADARAGKQDLVASLVRMQNEIIDKVVLGDLAGSREIINRFLGVIFLESGMNFDVLKVRLLEFIIIISRAAIEKGISAEGLLGPRYSFLTDINAAAGFDDLFWKVTKALENFSGTVSEQMGRKKRIHVTRMKDYVKKNFTLKISAREVAAAAGVSVSRALHLFHEECGMPLSAYVARERIEYAKYLIDNTDDSMATIASECGFFDQSHFTKTFSALENIPPSRYRRKARGG
jgi:AraC-like DNA-binding protein/ligand-binding sensor protein